MTADPKKTPGRWDGWDDPNYQPTQEELETPITVPEGVTPEDIARALMQPSPPVHWPDPDDEYTHLDD